MDNEELLNSAIQKVRVKIQPVGPTQPKAVANPEEAYKQAYGILEIWGADTQDPDLNYKAKFIYDFLTEDGGKAHDKIVEIMKSLPAITNESNVERIYKYCRLKDEYRKTMAHADEINRRMKSV